MKILWFGDAAETGFGRVTQELGRRLLDRGYDVRFINTNVRGWPLTGPLAPRTWNRDYFSVADASDVLRRGLAGWKPDQVVILADMAAAREVIAHDPDTWKTLPVWHHVPIEGRELPPLWRKVWEIIRPVAITKFGADEITKITGRPTPFIHHGVDRSVFHPATPDNPITGIDESRDMEMHITSKAEAKRHFGLLPSDTILLRTDRHMPRKNYNALIRSVAPVLRADLKLVIHCRTLDQGGNLDDSKSKLPEEIQRNIGFTRGHDTWKGMGDNVLAALYNAADLYVSNCSEGFGLPLLESIACGTPVLGLDYSAVPEVIGDAGMLAPAAEIDNVYDHRWAVPIEAKYTKTLRVALTRLPELAAETQQQAARFTWDEAAAKFVGLFDEALMEKLAA